MLGPSSLDPELSKKQKITDFLVLMHFVAVEKPSTAKSNKVNTLSKIALSKA